MWRIPSLATGMTMCGWIHDASSACYTYISKVGVKALLLPYITAFESFTNSLIHLLSVQMQQWHPLPPWRSSTHSKYELLFVSRAYRVEIWILTTGYTGRSLLWYRATVRDPDKQDHIMGSTVQFAHVLPFMTLIQ